MMFLVFWTMVFFRLPLGWLLFPLGIASWLLGAWAFVMIIRFNFTVAAAKAERESLKPHQPWES